MRPPNATTIIPLFSAKAATSNQKFIEAFPCAAGRAPTLSLAGARGRDTTARRKPPHAGARACAYRFDIARRSPNVAPIVKGMGFPKTAHPG